ncbi:MAG TPA: class I SAM-dependent methyltransferase [Bryobacteraceae bacterium]|nr:class I SAM-dependent methyltransferase [Bryobacteraceae bacterium]
MSSPLAPNPERIFGLMNAHHHTAALKAGVELDVFTAIAEGVTTSEALASRCNASERGMRILCDFLAVMGLLTKENGAYGLSPDAALFLDRNSPACMGSVTRFLASDLLVQGFQRLTDAVRKGGTVMSESGTMEPEHPAWVEFAKSMVPLMAPAAQDIAAILAEGGGGVRKVLDIAAGHGIFGVTLARAFPEAEITALDWPAVLEVAKENAENAGITGRYRTIPGSVFDVELGGPYDVILVTNFFHHFDEPTCTALAKKILNSLSDKGRMVTLEFVPNPDRISPPVPASFPIIMLTSTAHGDAYTFAQFDQIFRAAGFTHNKLHQLTHSPEQLIVSHR